MDGVFMKNRKLFLTAAVLLALGTASVAVLQHQQQTFSQKLIRLHVVAHSDSAEDQRLKLQVRDAVLAVTQPLVATSQDPKLDLLQALPQIEQAAETCLHQLGREDTVRVSLGSEVFPTRVYEGFALPAGTYTALRVTIGDGAGHNWWCVAFPSICFRATAAELEQAAVAAGFTEGEVRLITGDGAGYVLKFKSLELLQALKDRLFAKNGS